jgi:hypothetical protein
MLVLYVNFHSVNAHFYHARKEEDISKEKYGIIP